ncbi:MAG: hypothetical protein KDC70_18450 [Saprospiraceae bacterium]|nr:hypothetical protein [Saprospiraceae bacterium]
MKTIFPLTLIAILLGLAPLRAQELLGIDISQRCIYTGEAMDEELYRFPRDERVDKWIRDIAEASGAPLDFEVVQTNVENISAVLDGEKRYLLYSLDFIEKSNEMLAVAALAHEIGHHACGHTFDETRRTTEELEAEQFAGYVLSKMGYDKQRMDMLIKLAPSAYDIPRQERRTALLEGFDKAERALKIASLPFDNDPALQALTLPGFPWPPPSCHTRFELPEKTGAAFKTLGDADVRLRRALDAKGYSQRSYFSVPDGFALVTQLEQYNGEDGAVRNDRTRWLDYPKKENFDGVMDYLKSLVMPQKGYFRLFVFVVTDRGFGGSAQRVSKAEATAWLSQGFNKLPASLAAANWSTGYGITALVYEFEVPESNRKPKQQCPTPHIDAQTHLKKSGIAGGLGL